MNPNYSKNSVLKLNDYSVSGEAFQLYKNLEFGFLETHPKPNQDKLPDYYKSENYISHTDTKRNVFEKLYHTVRAFALNRKIRLISKYTSPEKNLLDIGCGTGDFLKTAQQHNWGILGIEPNAQARTIANTKTKNAVFAPDKLLTLKPSTFDVITLWHVLEHLPDLENQIEIYKALLKPNGTLIVAVPNYKSYDAQFYKQHWAAYDVPRHLWHFNRKSVSALFSKYHLKVTKTKPMWFDAFYVSLLSEQYKSGKMNYVKAFIIGMLSNLKAVGTKEASSLIYVIKNI
ncbi:MAG: class I SAM-dependent methyltransferase [Flavobacteriaceae bacterium]